MKVVKALPISGDGWGYTTLLLDEDIPSGKWTKVVAGDQEYETVYMSGGRLDSVSVKGVHDLAGWQITFS